MEQLFQYSFTKYQTAFYADHSNLEDYVDNYSNFKHGQFKYLSLDDSEETYVKNYGNPLTHIEKKYLRFIIEKNDEKISLKLFFGYRTRQRGKNYFKTSKNCEFITISKKTGDLYQGKIYNYQKKIKVAKTFQKNYFSEFNLLSIFNKIRNIDEAWNSREHNFSEAMKILTSEFNLDTGRPYELKEYLIKNYLDKKNIKYPDNILVFFDKYENRLKIKDIRKSKNKFIDAFMKCNNLSGDVIKKALHVCEGTNVKLLRLTLELFGKDWVLQDYELVLGCLNSKIDIFYPKININRFSKDEKRRIYYLFKEYVVLQESIHIHWATFFDHLNFFEKLESHGEKNLTWKATNISSFNSEHNFLSSLVEYHSKGFYKRIYFDYLYEFMEKPIVHNDEVYYPILLDNTKKYVDESDVQSNCVKNYIGNPGSYVFSLRKNSKESNIRATIEFYLYKNDGNDVCFKMNQALGRFNERLDETWFLPVSILMDRFSNLMKDQTNEIVRIEKIFKSGKKLTSDTYWDDTGRLRWSSVDLTSFYD